MRCFFKPKAAPESEVKIIKIRPSAYGTFSSSPELGEYRRSIEAFDLIKLSCRNKITLIITYLYVMHEIIIRSGKVDSITAPQINKYKTILANLLSDTKSYHHRHEDFERKWSGIEEYLADKCDYFLMENELALYLQRSWTPARARDFMNEQMPQQLIRAKSEVDEIEAPAPMILNSINNFYS